MVCLHNTAALQLVQPEGERRHVLRGWLHAPLEAALTHVTLIPSLTPVSHSVTDSLPLTLPPASQGPLPVPLLSLTPPRFSLTLQVKARSKYEEDVYINNHTAVWGSWWQDGMWGYACCRQTTKNSYCLGSAGQQAKQVAEEQMLKNIQEKVRVGGLCVVGVRVLAVMRWHGACTRGLGRGRGLGLRVVDVWAYL